jgi:hypothetical protein
MDDARNRILYGNPTRKELTADCDLLSASRRVDDIMLVRLMRNEVLFSGEGSEVGGNCRLLTVAELADPSVRAWSPAYPVDLPDSHDEPAPAPPKQKARAGWWPVVAVAALAAVIAAWSWGAV